MDVFVVEHAPYSGTLLFTFPHGLTARPTIPGINGRRRSMYQTSGPRVPDRVGEFMKRPVSLLGLATAVPPYRIDQELITQLAPLVFGKIFDDHPGMADIFAHTGVSRRNFARPLEWFSKARDWGDRADAYIECAGELFVRAAKSALTTAGLTAADIDIVVTISSTGIATPSVDARVGTRMGWRHDITRVPVFGLGCAGGVTGLALASRLARAEPGKNVLLVAVELCSLAFRFDQASKTELIAAALFGDGAAAAVLRTDDNDAGFARIGDAAEHTWPETLEIMGWTIDPVGFGVVLSPELPRFLAEHLSEPAREFSEKSDFDGKRPHPVCHIGSLKVLAAMEGAFGLCPGALAIERHVLSENGNMSSPSVLFVLAHALDQGRCGPAVLSALGPGFTASFVAADIGHA
jgi:alkylresorcinol/alkylpyrone synthase